MSEAGNVEPSEELRAAISGDPELLQLAAQFSSLFEQVDENQLGEIPSASEAAALLGVSEGELESLIAQLSERGTKLAERFPELAAAADSLNSSDQ
jgi:hypothetical protein